MTVYMVTSGYYSDYTVDGIFSAQELAQAYIKEAGDGEVEEVVLDERKEWKNLEVWQAEVRADGTLFEGCRQQMFGTPETVQCSVPGDKFYNFPKVGGRGRSAKSQEHANKLAIEAYQAWLRERGA